MRTDKKKQRGVCALCQQDNKELRKSHLLGRAIYLLNRDGDDDPVMMTPQLITSTRRQIWRHLLCGDCEQRFYRATRVLRPKRAMALCGAAVADLEPANYRNLPWNV